MRLPDWLRWVMSYAKRHTFHVAMIVALVIICFIEFSQYTMIGSVYALNRITDSKLGKHVSVYERNRSEDLQFVLDSVEAEGTKLSNKLAKEKMQLNSRIDILDSAVEPDKKKRMLVAKIREAILDNTETKLSIRDLNNISIAVVDYSYRYNLSVAKVLAQMQQESDFNIKARSHARAMGLMQVIPETWEYIVLKEFDSRRGVDPDSIYHNIRAGCFYMSEQVLKFDTYDQALMGYNWGPHNVRAWLAGDIPDEEIPRETKRYVELINRNIEIYKSYGLE